jgi:hypothetical protein
MRILLVFAHGAGGETLAYRYGWSRAFIQHPSFDCVSLDVIDRSLRGRSRRRQALRLPDLDAVVVLHSVFSNELHADDALIEKIAGLPVPKALFLGNEYKLLPEKVAFARALGTNVLFSVLSSPAAHAEYERMIGCRVVGIPNAGLDTDVFIPTTPLDDRPVDLGYRAYPNPWYIGHDERRELHDRVAEAAPRYGLVTDFSLDAADRFDQQGWVRFLDRCKGQIGSEAGGDWFDPTDALRDAVNAFLEDHPQTPFTEVHERFFHGKPAISGRALSGRVVEAAGMRSAQVLLAGEYGGYFQAGEHYIALQPDFSNLDEALALFSDPGERARVANNAYEVAVGELTYDRLAARVHKELAGLL